MSQTAENTTGASSSAYTVAQNQSDQASPTKDFGFLPIPRSCRYNAEKPVHFGLTRIIVFGLASTFSVSFFVLALYYTLRHKFSKLMVELKYPRLMRPPRTPPRTAESSSVSGMNLYYCQPLLVQLATAFHVTDQEVSRIPTLIQAGYATGLVLVSPLGDLVRRRQLLLLLMTLAASLSIGLAITHSLLAFEIISFFVGVISVTPQILIPLTADLAPPSRRASAISIVLAGLLMGVLLARVLAGIIAQFSSFRNVYWMGVGGQYLLLFGLYIFCPDTPAKNKHLNYFSILTSMAKLAVTEPMLIQACLISVASAAIFSSFWVTMTFLLSGTPYNFNTLDIGLFGLVGMVGVCTAPFIGRLIDGLIPWMATLIATTMILISQVIQVGAGGISIGAVVVATFILDVGRQSQQVSLTTAVYGISLEARARLNAVLILSIFLGQVMGTSVGTKVFVEHGWRATAGVNLAWVGWQLALLFLRGPHCARHTWFGWQGGAELRKAVVEARLKHEKDDDATEAPGLDESTPANAPPGLGSDLEKA